MKEQKQENPFEPHRHHLENGECVCGFRLDIPKLKLQQEIIEEWRKVMEEHHYLRSLDKVGYVRLFNENEAFLLSTIERVWEEAKKPEKITPEMFIDEDDDTPYGLSHIFDDK